MIRVRFAPSPTGYLHVGGARTALYNFLFARQNKGKFILRIEDTDENRSTEEAIIEITNSLKWLGLEWDEGPNIGGDFGPYRQTQRKKLYQDVATSLLEKNKAYFCFCQAQDLEQKRKEQLAAGKAPIYPGTCRNLPKEKIEEFRKEGTKPAIRLLTPYAGSTFVEDLIKGKITFENKVIDDYIILRSDGTPTYNLAVVIDDFSMKITHVIRGDDHLSNTPRQIVLYQALGYDIPRFAHLPLIAGPDKKPLSKRHGSVSIEDFQKKGYLPEALINYLALLGWGYDEKTTFFSISDLVEKFSLEKVNKNSAIWDSKKFLWMNGEYIRKLSDSQLASMLQEILKKEEIEETDKTKLENIAAIIKERIRTLNEIFPLIEFFYKRIKPDEDAKEFLKKTKEARSYLQNSIEILQSLTEFKTDNLEQSLRSLAQDLDVKPGLLFQLIRASISGRKVSPPLFESLEILRKNESIHRIKKTIENYL